MPSPPDCADLAGIRWNPDQYAKFSDHRLRPAIELLARVPLEAPRVIYDLGSGPGNVTRLIAKRWPAASICGVDNSPEMLRQAAATPSNIRWTEADVAAWTPPEAPDLLYANASLHWIDDHERQFPRLIRSLAPGGCLAVQMPLNWNTPSHRLMCETLANGGPNGAPLGTEELRRSLSRDWVGTASSYYDLLAACTRTLDIWETEYLQVLEGLDPVLEWVKGTGLRPVLNSLNEAERKLFLDEYSRRLREAYPTRANGRTLFPFRRLFLVACV